MILRDFEKSDCQEVLQLFYDTIHAVNTKDYSQEQVSAWAPKTMDLPIWENRLLNQSTIVAAENSKIIGFGSVTKSGEIDLLYVEKDNIGKGIGTVICNELEKRCNARKITTYASITAKPFFEKLGYRVIQKNKVERQGVELYNYLMAKEK